MIRFAVGYADNYPQEFAWFTSEIDAEDFLRGLQEREPGIAFKIIDKRKDGDS